MRPYEFKRIYPPALGKFVNKFKGTGVLVTNVKKTLFSKVAKPVQKALKSGTEHVGKEIGEISGDYIMKKLSRSKKQTGSNAHVIFKRLRQEFFF